MKALTVHLPTAVISLLLLSGLDAQNTPQEQSWEKPQAMTQIYQADTDALLEPLFRLARSGSDRELLESLAALDSDSRVDAPVRDYTAYRFTVALADFEPYSVHASVLDFLAAWRPAVLVPHEDHPRHLVPLFNVPAAAAGVRHAWARETAAGRSLSLLSGPAEEWLAAFLAAGVNSRRGYLDALESATPEQLARLGEAAAGQLEERPELARVAARAAIESGDLDLMKQSVAHAGGPDLPRILADAGNYLDGATNYHLLLHCLARESGSTAALAIAQLAGPQLKDPAVRQLMFETLEHPQLGSAAALTLGVSGDPDILAELNAIAKESEGLAAKRANIALSAQATRKEGAL
jgi:hypothetical protein